MGRNTQVTVIPLLGADFAGGSLVNLLLDSHPEVFGCGDVYKLFDRVKKANCSVCIRDCPIWNDAALMSELTVETVYDRIAERTGTGVLVDSSKILRHFDIVFGQDHITLVPAVLVKHPARLMGSFLGNKYIPTEIGIEKYSEEGASAMSRESVAEALDHYFARIAKLYGTIAEFLELDHIRRHSHVIVYEDVVASPREALAPLLETIGLTWSDEMLAFSDIEHHPIGGNAAAHYHLRRQPNPKLQARRERRMITEKRAFYGDKRQPLRLDNKYLALVPEEWRADILSTASYRAACSELGYDPQSV